MEFVLNIILLIVGLGLLIKGSDWLIQGASSLASRLAIPEAVIGLTIVAFGTSTPELVVNIVSSLHGNAEIALGNVVGSNVVNILLILGIAGIIRPLHTHKNTIWREIPFSLLAVFVLFVMVNDRTLDDSPDIITRGDGLILLFFFTVFLTYVFIIAKVEVQESPQIKEFTYFKIWVFILTGLIMLFGGGKLTVENVVEIARRIGISEQFIALTVIAAGTSLPELFTSAVAAYRGKSDIAMGNVVGSNIFNIFFILAVSALIHPLNYQISFNMDIWILMLASVLLFLTMFTGTRRVLDRWEAILFAVLYAAYIIYNLYRG
jgi:cation:H+ antiporter